MRFLIHIVLICCVLFVTYRCLIVATDALNKIQIKREKAYSILNK